LNASFDNQKLIPEINPTWTYSRGQKNRHQSNFSLFTVIKNQA